MKLLLLTVLVQTCSQGEVTFKIIPASSKEEMSSNKKKVQVNINYTYSVLCVCYVSMQSGCMGKAAHLVLVKRDKILCVFGYVLCFCHNAVTTSVCCQEVNSDQTVKDKTLTNFVTICRFLSFKPLIYHFAHIPCVEPHELN